MDLRGHRIGNYVIESEINRGGMGTVYLGLHRELGRPMAIKVVDPEAAKHPRAADRFLREARVSALVEHHNVARTFDYGVTVVHGREAFYLIMEYLRGRTLADRLDAEVVDQWTAVHVAIQCADALAAVHDLGIVHRDVTPNNVMLTRSGGDNAFVKLIDFGVARPAVAGARAPGYALTKNGMLVGTPAYMSPEQSMGAPDVDPRSDVYSLGVMLYEMLTALLPFRGSTQEILAGHRTRTPVPPSLINPDIGFRLERIVLRALNKQLSHRFSTMAELADELRLVRPNYTVPSRPRSAQGSSSVATTTLVLAAPGPADLIQ